MAPRTSPASVSTLVFLFFSRPRLILHRTTKFCLLVDIFLGSQWNWPCLYESHSSSSSRNVSGWWEVKVMTCWLLSAPSAFDSRVLMLLNLVGSSLFLSSISNCNIEREDEEEKKRRQGYSSCRVWPLVSVEWSLVVCFDIENLSFSSTTQNDIQKWVE